MKLFLAEYEHDVQKLLDLYRSMDQEEARWVALEPFAEAELDRLSIPYTTAENILSNEEIYLNSGQTAEQKVNQLISEAHRTIDSIRYYHYPLLIILEGFCYRLFVLQRLMDELKPEKVYIVDNNASLEGDDLLFNQNAVLWAKCMKLFDIPVETIDTIIIIPKQRAGIKYMAYKIFIQFPFLYSVYLYLKKEGPNPFAKGSKNLLLLGNSFNWQGTYELFESNGFRIKQLVKTDAMLPPKTPPPEMEFLNNVEYSKIFTYLGMDFSSLVIPLLKRVFTDAACTGKANYEFAKKYIKDNTPSALLLSVTISSPWFVAKAFRESGLPVILWSHGAGAVAEHSNQIYAEILDIDYYLNQGHGATAKYNQYCKIVDFTPLPIGSVSIDKTMRSLRSNENTIKDIDVLYISTNYYQNYRYSAFKPCLTDNSLFEVQKKIILETTASSDINVVWKAHPSPQYRKPPVNLPSNTRMITNETTLRELYPRAKAIVLDMPTTTLLESVTTEVPVFVYTGFMELTSHANELLQKRAVVNDNIDVLLEDLSACLSRGQYQPDVNNREFLLSYSCHSEDGNSAKRAYEAVLNIIAKSSLEN